MALTLGDDVVSILQRQLTGLPRKTEQSILEASILKYATTSDWLILCISILCAICAGILNPLIAVIFGQLVGIFDAYVAGTVFEERFRSKVASYTLYYIYLAIAIFILIYISTVGFYYSGERIIRATRNAYLESTLRQNMAYFKVRGPGDITTRIMSDMNLIQEGITSKVSIALTAFATFATAFVIVFIMDWRTALVLCPTFVIMVAVFTFGGNHVVKDHKQSALANGKASTLAEEVIASMRHVTASGTQDHFALLYKNLLKSAGVLDIRSRCMIAGMVAWSNAVPSLVYALAFWSGSIFLVKGWINVAQLTTAAMVVTIGAFAIARVGPAFQALASTVSSAGLILGDISRRSPQDPFSPEGECPNVMSGHVELRGVSLVYPTREAQLVLDDVTFTCPALETTAIVGSSGSGKSSIIKLLERFYEPTAGRISIDGRDIHSLNLRWLRSHMALVGQSPVLFDTTIFENICYGQTVDTMVGISHDEETSREKVYRAAKEANAHDFIMSLPDGYQTKVGAKGLQLSGGQRQRIAIARALIRQPSILLLDEATSALDTKSEIAVQAALDTSARHRTTIIVAHRLSTIRNADKIIVMSNGCVVETGQHSELMLLNGHYAESVRAQQITDDGSAQIMIGHPEEQSESALDVSAAQKADSGPKDTLDALASPADTRQAKAIDSLSLIDTLAFIIRLNRGDYILLLAGLLFSIIAGLGIPGQSVLFAKMLETLGLPTVQYSRLRDQVNLYSGLFLMLAGVAFIAWLALGISFAYSTQRLSRRLRNRSFESIISQDIAFFDEKEHKTGSLLVTLSSSCEDVVGLGGPVMGGTLCFVSTIFGGIILSVAVGWKLALVCTATAPIIVACGWVRLQVLAVFDSKTRQNGQDAASYASELVQQIDTVASLGLEKLVLERYDRFLERQSESSMRSILVASSLYAASQSVVYLCAALAFWYGGTLVADHGYSLFTFFICFSALISGSQIAGSIFAFAPDASKAMHASWELKNILDRKPKINDNRSIALTQHKGEQTTSDDKGPSAGVPGLSAGSIEFRDVSFSYPSRPDQLALDGFNLRVQAGQNIALVGPSGCGKSTVFSLIERFYNPDFGSILAGGDDIAELDLARYRSSISLVSQDAILYTGTIRENIALRAPGQDLDDQEIMDACKQANIHDFVVSLQDGLSTLVGPSGCTLSGGQKQRISIARALLRRPRILLLDEATSALDTQSEALVQAALTSASKGKTTISIAHRLSTVQKADCICVLDKGKVVESGSHDQLLALKGRYWEFVRAQNLD